MKLWKKRENKPKSSVDDLVVESIPGNILRITCNRDVVIHKGETIDMQMYFDTPQLTPKVLWGEKES